MFAKFVFQIFGTYTLRMYNEDASLSDTYFSSCCYQIIITYKYIVRLNNSVNGNIFLKSY